MERENISGLFFSDADVDQLFLSMMDNARDPMIVLTDDLRVKVGNRSFYKNFHVTPDETAGRQIFELGNKQWNIPKLRLLLEDILPSQSSFEDFEVEHEFQIIGRKVMLLNARKVLGPPPAREKLILLAIEDITERKKLEEDIQGAMEYTENILETVRDPLLVLNSGLKVLTVNQAFCDTFKVVREETIGNFVYYLGNRQWNIPKLRLLLEDILLHNTVFNGYEVEHEFLDIGRKTILLNARQIFRECIGSHIILLAMEDITERKRIERQRDQAYRAREELVAVVSHEIKNPLTTITSSLDLIRRTMSPREGQEKIQKLLDNIYAAARRMTRITSDLLDVTRLESGHFLIEPSKVGASGLVEEVIAIFRPVAEVRSIRLQGQVSPEVSTITCDRGRIIQVLSNLLNNAIKFTPDGGTIRVEVDRQEEEILFQVKDTGSGIPADQIPHVFERFWQAKHKQYFGSGLGLYIAKNIVETHGGRIGLKSKVGEGSAFYFTLSARGAIAVKRPRKIA